MHSSKRLSEKMRDMPGRLRFAWRQQCRRLLPSRQNERELLILSARGNSHGLAYPFHLYRKALWADYSLGVREILDNTIEEKSRTFERAKADIVLYSPPLRGPDGKMVPVEVIERFFREIPRDREYSLVFFDISDGPIGRHFGIAPYVDLYVMPFTFSDQDDYAREFLGGNKFAHFASQHYGLAPTHANEYWPEVFDSRIEPEHLPKIFTIHNWQFWRRLHGLYLKQNRRCSTGGERGIDVHCRFQQYTGWCRAHRLHVRDVLQNLKGRYSIVASEQKVSLREYYSEIGDSKILFSPFGWGDICPKDWEAFLKGCLLMKPSVEHVKSFPHTHIPYETYVPVKWDLSDVQEKVTYYLENSEERQRIVVNAARVVEEFYDGDAFVSMVKDMLSKLGHNV